MSQFNVQSDGNYITPITPRGIRHDSDPDVTQPVPEGVAPPGTTGSYEKLVAFERDNIKRLEEELPVAARDDTFEEALSGRVDINTLFGEMSDTGQLTIIPSDQYLLLKEAKAAETAGNPSPDQVSMLNSARDPNGQFRQTFDNFAQYSDNPALQGFVPTGGFPLDPESGKVILPPETEEKYVTPQADAPLPAKILQYLGGLGTRNEIQNQTEGQARIREFIKNRADGPTDPDIQDALLQTIGTDFADIFAERIYNLASVSELGLRHYLPTYGKLAGLYLYDKVPFTGDASFPSDADVQEELADLKKSQLFSNRTTFVNDMIREQLFVLYGEEKFNRLGLDEKNEDGQFVRQFVGQKFSEDLFEAMFDDLHWSQKLGAYVLEGAVIIGATRGVAAPVVAGMNIYRMGARAYKSSKDLVVPISFLPTKTIRTMAGLEAGSDRALDVSAKARELLRNSQEYRVLSNFRINSIAKAVGREQSKVNIAADRTTYAKQIVTRTNEYENASDVVVKITKQLDELKKTPGADSGDMIKLQDDLRIARETQTIAENNLRFTRAKRNNAIAKSFGIKVRELGFHPEYDLLFALSMTAGRAISTGERDPETGFPLEPQKGLVGEGVAALGFLAYLTVTTGFKIGKDKFGSKIGPAGSMDLNTGFRIRNAFESVMSSGVESSTSLFGIYRQGIAEGWLVNPSVKNIVFADVATRSKFSAKQTKNIQSFTNTILRMPTEYQDAIFDSLDVFFEDTHNVMKVLEPLVESGVLSMKELSEYRQLLSAGFGETSGLAVLKAYGEVYTANASTLGIKPKHILKAKSRLTDLIDTAEHYKQRSGVLSQISEQLDAKALNLEEAIRAQYGDDRTAMVALDILKQYSQSLKSSASYHGGGYVESISRAMEEIDIAIKGISETELPSMLDIAATEGLLEDLLVASSRLETLKSAQPAPPLSGIQKAQEDLAALPDPNASPSQAEIYTEAKRQMQDAAKVGPPAATSTIRTKVDALMANLTRVANNVNLSATQASDVQKVDSLLTGIVNVADEGRFAEVTLAYDRVSNVRSIPLTRLTTEIIDYIEAELSATGRSPTNLSFVSQMSRKAFSNKFGRIGGEFYEGIHSAATEGLTSYFSRPDRLEVVSEITGKPVTTAREAIDELKDLVSSYDSARVAMGTDNADVLRNMTDLQLATILIRDPSIAAFDARSFNFIASPKELEELRRLAVRLKTNKTMPLEVRNLGGVIETSVEQALEAGLQGLDETQLNAVVTARVLHRLAMQRFDVGSFGKDVRNLESPAPATVFEGRVEKGQKSVTRTPSNLLDPMIDAILKPTKDMDLKAIPDTIDRLIKTLSPVTPNPNLVIRRPDGTARMPTDTELSGLVSQSMPEATFNTLRNVLNVTIRRRMDELYDVNEMRRAMEAGVIPKLTLNKEADEIVVPSGSASLDDYFDSINDQLRVNVDGYDSPVLLFDIRDVFYAKRDVSNTINSTEELIDAHGTIVDNLKAAGRADQRAGEAAIATSKEQAVSILQYSENASTGAGFFKNVINTDDADGMRKFLDTLAADKGMNPEQKQQALRSLFIQVMKEVGGHGSGTVKVKLPNGDMFPMDGYSRPGELFFLFDDALNSAGSGQTGLNFMLLAEAAGIAPETMEAYRSIFRLGFRESAESIVQSGRGLGPGATSTKPGIIIPKGYSVDNAIARAFNLARQMVSTEYVMAEAIFKYAGVAKGKTVQFLVNDPKAAEIIHALLSESRRVVEEDARYLIERVTKLIGRDVKPFIDKYDPRDEAQQKQYWESQGFVFDVPFSALPAIPNILSPVGPSTI